MSPCRRATESETPGRDRRRGPFESISQALRTPDGAPEGTVATTYPHPRAAGDENRRDCEPHRRDRARVICRSWNADRASAQCALTMYSTESGSARGERQRVPSIPPCAPWRCSRPRPIVLITGPGIADRGTQRVGEDPAQPRARCKGAGNDHSRAAVGYGDDRLLPTKVPLATPVARSRRPAEPAIFRPCRDSCVT